MYHISRGEADIPHGGGRIDMVFHSCVDIITTYMRHTKLRVHAPQIEQLHRLNAWLKIKIIYFVFHFRHIVQLL